MVRTKSELQNLGSIQNCEMLAFGCKPMMQTFKKKCNGTLSNCRFKDRASTHLIASGG